MKTGVIIQARNSSTRLPAKIMLPLPLNGGKSILGHVVERCKKACPMVIVATTENIEDDVTVAEAEKYGAKTYRGSLEDVLSRYMGAAKQYELDNIVRITSDCPFIDPILIDGAIKLLQKSGADYVSNAEKRTFPHGMDTEAFTFKALEKADRNEKRPEIREHVTLHIRRTDDFRKLDLTNKTDIPSRPDIRVTLDTVADYTAILTVFDMLPVDFAWYDIVNLYEKKPYLMRINDTVYQKNVFIDTESEMVEAAKLLRLHNMVKAEELIKNWKKYNF